jgi:hypothetical protein
MHYRIWEKLTNANCWKKSGFLQLVEKKGKRASSIAWIIHRPENRLGRLGLKKVIENNILGRCLSVAPMMGD